MPEPLAERTADGADAQLEERLRAYAALIRRIVSRIVGADASGAADDIAQQVLVNLWRQLEREQRIDHPASYIYRAAVRETVRAVRRARAREQPMGDAAELAPRLVTHFTAHDALEAKERAEALGHALAQVAPDRRRAVQAHLAGYDVAEIMRLFGWPYQKARNLVSRGMADLREQLIKKGIRG